MQKRSGCESERNQKKTVSQERAGEERSSGVDGLNGSFHGSFFSLPVGLTCGPRSERWGSSPGEKSVSARFQIDSISDRSVASIRVKTIFYRRARAALGAKIQRVQRYWLS